MKLVGTGVTLSHGDERDSVSEGHFIEQFGCIVQGIRLNIEVKKNVLRKQVKRSASLENVAVEALPCIWVTILNGLLEQVGVGMGIQRTKVMVK
ncbi:hypothetical protein SESBI_08082 [Sesbania bispinosa]|nr:hypothetical protein SESBI_08082 [Sesbania bispinosa]